MSLFWGLPDRRLHADAGETVSPSQLLPLTSNTFLFLVSLLIGSHTDNRSGSICEIQLHACKRLEIHLEPESIRHIEGSCKKSGNRNINKRRQWQEQRSLLRARWKRHALRKHRTHRGFLWSFALMHKQTCSESLNVLTVNMKSTSLYLYTHIETLLPSNQFIYR